MKWMRGKGKARKEEVSRIISLASSTIERCLTSGAQLGAAISHLDSAEESLRERNYSSAEVSAQKAESLANLLEGRYISARKAISSLFKIVQKMKESGLDTFEYEAILERSKRRMEELVEEDGEQIPDYLGARSIAIEGAKLAEKTLEGHETASNAIFVAEMILDNTVKSMVHMDKEILLSKVFEAPIKMLKKSKTLLSSGKYQEAYEISSDAEKKIQERKKLYERAIQAYRQIERATENLPENEGPVREIKALIEVAESSMNEGDLEKAADLFTQAAEEISDINERRRKALEAIDLAQSAINELKKTGVDLEEPENLLEEAKWALEEGIYQRAVNFAEDSRKGVQRVEEMHKRIFESLEETKGKLGKLREAGIDVSEEVENVIEKAERELNDGAFANSNEDLMIARILIDSLSRKHHISSD